MSDPRSAMVLDKLFDDTNDQLALDALAVDGWLGYAITS